MALSRTKLNLINLCNCLQVTIIWFLMRLLVIIAMLFVSIKGFVYICNRNNDGFRNAGDKQSSFFIK